MRTSFSLALLVALVAVAGCSNPAAPGAPGTYFPATVGSAWLYTDGRSIFTMNVMSDTVVDGTAWHVMMSYFNNVTSHVLQRNVGGVHYRRTIDSTLEWTLLDETAGGSWNYVDTAGALHYQCSTVEHLDSRYVWNRTFSDLLRVHVLTYALPPYTETTAESDYYYARNVGLVQVVTRGSADTLYLLNYDIK
ncbi:MAG TPA: hypothetical protein VHI13_07090 [Candidatus Kapabacteria bacterium]|nr:hypothetical protein [Candidatus Kapabacteria bacterium]